MKTTLSEKTTTLLLLIIPFIIWSFVFRDFWLRRAPLFPDGQAYYSITKYFIDNITRGVYPLWTPFYNWGRPDNLDIRFIGEFNPLLLIPAFLYQIGIKFSTAYFIYAIGYYFLGVIGFYLIAKHFFKDTTLALLSFCLLLFSSASVTIFFNYCEIVIFVPAIWFFYFWLKFHQSQERKYILGMTFSLMIIMVTYMPFYFLTILMLFLLLSILFYPRNSLCALKRYYNFGKNNKMLVMFCIVAVVLASMPGYLWYKEAGGGEFHYSFRHADAKVTNMAAVSKKHALLGGIVGPLSFRKLFSQLAYQQNQLSYFFLSFFIYIVILLSIFNKLSRQLILFFIIGFVMFLISITSASGFYEFLYDNIFYFKLIRNIYYLLQLALPFIILFVVEQLRIFLNREPKKEAHKYITAGFVILVHLVFAWFLYKLDDIIVTTYLTLFISLGYFVLFCLGFIRFESIISKMILILLVVLQPIQVFSCYSHNVRAKAIRQYEEIKKRPEFSYVRPRLDENIALPENTYKESDGFGADTYVSVTSTRALLDNVDLSILNKYAYKKFIAYDRISPIDFNTLDWKKLEDAFDKDINVAFVSEEDAKEQKEGDSISTKEHPEFITHNSETFKVLSFDLNHIKFRTNFPKDKFLVYNDSFHSGWRAIVNGKPQKIIRANVAFKGLWLKAGENIVYMRFGSKFLYSFYWLLLFYFYAFFAYLIWELKKTKT